MIHKKIVHGSRQPEHDEERDQAQRADGIPHEIVAEAVQAVVADGVGQPAVEHTECPRQEILVWSRRNGASPARFSLYNFAQSGSRMALDVRRT